MSAVTDLAVERRYRAASAVRRRTNFVLFLGPAIALTFLFFVIPVLIDIAVSFTDLDRTLRISKFTTDPISEGLPRRLAPAAGHRPDCRLRLRHARHLQCDLRSRTRAHHDLAQQDFRGVLPRCLAATAHEPFGPLHFVVAVGHQPLGCGAVEPVSEADAWSDQAAGFADECARRADHHRQWIYWRIAGHDHLHRGDTRHP